MKIEIIPSINVENLEEFKYRIKLLEDLTNHFHLDISDIEFTGYQSWGNIKDLSLLEIENQNKLIFDVHLMMNLKAQEVLKWGREIVKNLILHLEGSLNPDGLLRIAKKTKKNILIAWSPDLDFDFIKKYLPYTNGILILGVSPGRSGQKFLSETYSRISLIKPILNANQKLGIDGGINEENFKEIIKFQPNFLVMGSALYNAENPQQKFKWFLNEIEKFENYSLI